MHLVLILTKTITDLTKELWARTGMFIASKIPSIGLCVFHTTNYDLSA